MSRFDYTFRWLMTIEGGYVNDPDDPGGETKYGISKRSHPDLDIKNLTKPQAKVIYFSDYWLAAKCDQLPRHLAAAAFDAAVHSGPKRAMRWLQQAVGVEADGVYGPITHKAAWQVDAFPAVARMLAVRAAWLAERGNERPALRKFMRGWMARLFSLHRHVLEMPR